MVQAQGPPPERDTIGIGLVEVPVDRQEDPRALTYIVDHVQPGAVITRRIQVVNGHDETVTLDLYASAAQLADGSFVVADGRGGGPPADWITVEPASVSVPAMGREAATITIDVPRDATRGEHYAAVLAELGPGGGGGIRVASRVGVRVYLSVGPGGEPPSDFEIHSLRAARDVEGLPIVEATVENTGERAIDVSGELSLENERVGLTAGPFPAQGVATLGPGDEGSFLVPLDPQLPAGPWSARLVARSGTIERAAEATIVFPGAAGESSAAVDATEVPIHQDRGVLIPVAVGLLILALALVLLVWFLAKRRRDDADDEESATETEATVGPAE